MKPALIAMFIVGFVSGCATLQDVERHLYGNSGASGRNNAPVKPVKQKALWDSVVGEYEAKISVVGECEAKMVRINYYTNHIPIGIYI